MQVYSRSGSLILDPDELLDKTLQDYTGPWYAMGGGSHVGIMREKRRWV
jgi:hypothetical protein